jgi:hypothetical protein
VGKISFIWITSEYGYQDFPSQETHTHLTNRFYSFSNTPGRVYILFLLLRNQSLWVPGFLGTETHRRFRAPQKKGTTKNSAFPGTGTDRGFRASKNENPQWSELRETEYYDVDQYVEVCFNTSLLNSCQTSDFDILQKASSIVFYNFLSITFFIKLFHKIIIKIAGNNKLKKKQLINFLALYFLDFNVIHQI